MIARGIVIARSKIKAFIAKPDPWLTGITRLATNRPSKVSNFKPPSTIHRIPAIIGIGVIFTGVPIYYLLTPQLCSVAYHGRYCIRQP
jgi:hypothetical protein